MPTERTSSGFGEKLRDARERRGVSLRQIANATKISVGVLEALERNDISKLPGGIFGRAFVRSYAIEVGLDPETTIQDFIEQFPNDSVIAGHPATDRVEDHEAVESDQRTAGTFLWLTVVSVPIAAGLLYFATLGRQAEPRPELPAVTAPAVESHPAVDPPPPAPAAADAPVAAPASTATSVTTAAVTTPAATTSAASTPAPVAAATAAPAVAAPAADQLTVQLTAKRPCWVSATVDGQKAIERLLQAGERQTITIKREMVVTAGDAAAIALQFNGADARPLGKSGEVVTARFNLNNYKDYLQVRVTGPTPLLDLFKAGDVDRDIRLEAAQGTFAPRAHEQLAILVFLLEDPDREVRDTADETLNRIPVAALQSFLARPDVPVDLREFFGDRGVFPDEIPPISLDDEAPLIDESGEDEDDERVSGLQELQSMTFPQRLKAAMKGTREHRAILIRDPNKMICASVLSSPKVSIPEVESFARMQNVSEDVLRIIGSNRAWLKSYGVILALTKNPKTPIGMSMNLMTRLTSKDLAKLSVDRNVPEALRISSRKKVASNQSGKD